MIRNITTPASKLRRLLIPSKPASFSSSTATRNSFHSSVYPILATPFHHGTEDLDIESFSKSIQFMKDCNCSGVTVVGVLGESNRLLDSEREKLIKEAVHVAGDMPVCVGTSHPGTRATRDLSQMAEELGASAVMVTPSREPAPLTPDKMVEYFQKVDEGISIPIVLQDHPASTQVNMSMDLVARICGEVKGVSAVKMESLPSPPKLQQLRQLLEDSEGANRPDVALLVGLGALYGAYDCDAGCDGFMTGFAFPEVLLAMIDAKDKGNRDDLHEIFAKWLPLIVFEQQPGVAVRKEVYRMRGLVESGTVRHPGGELSEWAAYALSDVVQRVIQDNTIDLTKPLTKENVWVR
jgi:4-hydroxy-tetrahydrodipicolinate synthase